MLHLTPLVIIPLSLTTAAGGGLGQALEIGWHSARGAERRAGWRAPAPRAEVAAGPRRRGRRAENVRAGARADADERAPDARGSPGRGEEGSRSRRHQVGCGRACTGRGRLSCPKPVVPGLPCARRRGCQCGSSPEPVPPPRRKGMCATRPSGAGEYDTAAELFRLTRARPGSQDRAARGCGWGRVGPRGRLPRVPGRVLRRRAPVHQRPVLSWGIDGQPARALGPRELRESPGLLPGRRPGTRWAAQLPAAASRR